MGSRTSHVIWIFSVLTLDACEETWWAKCHTLRSCSLRLFMFSSCACYRRTIRSLLADLPALSDSSRELRNSLTFLYLPQTRPHSTIQVLRKGHHRHVLGKALAKNDIRTKSRRRDGPLPREVRDVLARENNRRHLSTDDETVSGSAKFQLQWLQDPLKLANAVMDRLRIGADQQALELIRGSEKSVYVDGVKKGGQIDNVVSWNHVMEFYMHKRNPQEALKVYNEMKKRGHRPEAHTYTIMLNGFAKNIEHNRTVENAVSVYNSIFAPNSTVTPNTIHTNAVINVCARAGRMDSLWAIAGALPERGIGAADHITYTSILNAIRADTVSKVQGIKAQDGREAAQDRIINNAIQDGEKIWADVNQKSRAGYLTIDEPLTCAMGRLLLLSLEPKSWHNVFLLVEQTMRIATFETSQQQESSASSSGSSTDQGLFKAPSESTTPTDSASSKPIQNKKTGLINHTSYISLKPSNNTVSMLLQAAILTKNLQVGKYYWDLLTSEDGRYRISYDNENFAQYLRLLRISRSSKLVRDLLCKESTQAQANQLLLRGTFVIAMSTCVRDKNNPNVFDHATDIFEKMQQHISPTDAKVMEMYLEVAVVTTPGLGHRFGEFEPDPKKNNAMRALSRVEPFVPEIKDMILSKAREEQYEELSNRRRKKINDPRDSPHRIYQHKDILCSFLKAMIGTYDRLVVQKDLPVNLRESYSMNKKRNTAIITKLVPTSAPKRGERAMTYSERESGAKEFESQEERFDERARGIKAPKKLHSEKQDNYPSFSSRKATSIRTFRSDREQNSYQEGWGSNFALLAKRQQNSSKEGFIDVRA